MASPFLRPSVATNRLLSGGSSRAVAMASPRTVFDLLSPHKKRKPSPSPLAASDGASLPSDPLPTNNPSASSSLPTLLTGSSPLRGSVVFVGGSPCSVGDPTSSLNPSSGCFSVVGEIQEKGSDGTVIPSPAVASVSGLSPSDDMVGGLASEEALLQNPSCETVAEVGDLTSPDSNVSVPSSMPVDHAEDPSFVEASVRNRSADSVVDSESDVSVPISDDQKKRIDINRSFARAKRNLRICTERVSKARAEGLGSFKLEELLVEETWLEALPGEFQKPYMKNLCRFVECEVGGKLAIYPPPFLIFNALNSTSFDKAKVVIIGQDPYHGPGQAMGLSFSVPEGVKMPSSLVNIFKELQADVGCSIPSHGNLERWAIQGVLLLNAVLTVRQHQANSHAKRGWEVFTDAVIQTISRKKRGIIFLLWGNSAQEKSRLIDVSKHHVLKAAHPSGLSAHRGFFGCRHFSRTNQILEAAGLLPIDWQL